MRGEKEEEKKCLQTILILFTPKKKLESDPEILINFFLLFVIQRLFSFLKNPLL